MKRRLQFLFFNIFSILSSVFRSPGNLKIKKRTILCFCCSLPHKKVSIVHLCVTMTDVQLSGKPSDMPTHCLVFLVKTLHAARLVCMFAGHTAAICDAFRFNNKSAQHASAAEQRGLQTSTAALHTVLTLCRHCQGDL